MDCGLPGPSVHGILQARILEKVAIASSRGSSPPRDGTHVACIAGRFFIIWAIGESLIIIIALQCCISFYYTENWISYMYTYILSSLDSLPVHVTTEHWVESPVLYSRFSSVIYFIHSIVYMSVPISQFIPPLPSLFFSTSVSQFLLCKKVHL